MVLNAGLILTSYLSDITPNDLSKYINELDYFCIFTITLCYLNDIFTNTILLCAASCEFYDKKTINTMKNVSCVIALIKCGVYCFAMDIFVCLNLIWFTLIGIHVYRARLIYYEKHKNYCDNLFYNFLTLIWRLCALVMLLSASYTMEKSFKNALFKI